MPVVTEQIVQAMMVLIPEFPDALPSDFVAALDNGTVEATTMGLPLVDCVRANLEARLDG